MFRTPQVVLFSRDLEHSASFYRALGFEEVFRTPGEGTPIHIDLVLDGYRIGLASEASTREDHGLAPVVAGQRAAVILWTEDTPAAYSFLKELGATPVKAPEPWLDRLLIAWAEDPDGHLIQVVQSVTRPRSAVRKSPWPMRVDDLLFREAVEADIVVLQSFRNDPGVNRFMVRTSVDPDELRREWLAIPDSPTDYSCVVERSGQVVGMGFLDIVDGAGQPGHPTGTDGVIGYIVRPEVAGQGIGSATARALLRAAFERLGLRRVTAAANADNAASVAVLERAGMRRERHAIKALWHHELGWLDEVEYAMLDEEWAARTPS